VLSITDKAASLIRSYWAAKSGQSLRISAADNGNGGYNCVAHFDDQGPDDVVYRHEELTVVIHQPAAEMLGEVVLDVITGITGDILHLRRVVPTTSCGHLRDTNR